MNEWVIAALTVLASTLVSWGAAGERVKNNTRRIEELEKETDTQRVLNTQLALALERLQNLNAHLDRLEKRLDRGLYYRRQGDGGHPL